MIRLLETPLTKIRCLLSYYLRHRLKFSKRYALANLITPSTDAIVRAASRNRGQVPRPSVTHLIYHQETVDRLAAKNCIDSLAPQLHENEEVIVVDVGGTLDAELGKPFENFEWYSLVRCQTQVPEKKSYTYGLNATLDTAKADFVCLWRTDYVFPSGVADRYRALMRSSKFMVPYEVLIGEQHVRSDFVRDNWKKVANFDADFWRGNSRSLSLYETQDPALFCIEKKLWRDLGGMNHKLWGYGWQFAELHAQIRTRLGKRGITYFGGLPALHQFHDGSLQLSKRQVLSASKEHDNGTKRFQEFLGGEVEADCYYYRWMLPKLSDKDIV